MNAAKSFNILAISLVSHIIILMVQTKLFSDLYFNKTIPCRHIL